MAPMFGLRALIPAFLALAGTFAAALPVQAAGVAEAAKSLVSEHCSACHAVPGYSAQGLPTVEAPPFQAMADNPGTYTEPRLRAFLVKPHWPMEQFHLSPSDIDNIVAYLRSLRSD
jgi:mono/diheme cytochrome c family protein